MVKKPHYAIVERTDHLNTPPAHPHHTLAIRLRSVSTSFNLGQRIVAAEKEVGSNIWAIFRRLSTDDASEEQLVALIDQEIPGLGQVASVFGTQGDTTRVEDVWALLEFFMNIHVGLQRSPRIAWQDKKLRPEVLRLARLYRNQIAI